MEEGNRTLIQLGALSSGSSCKSMTTYINIAKIHGVKRSLTSANTEFGSTMTTNPRAQAVGTLQFFEANTAATDGFSLSYVMVLDYDVQFFNRKDIGQS